MTLSRRPAAESDDPFLRALFASTRERETTALPPGIRETFLDQQFFAQKTHYQTHYPAAKHDIILLDGKPIGRLWVDRDPDGIHILDIALIPERCGAGVGTRLLTELIEEGRATSMPVRIFVEQYNPAMRLYRRLGFEVKSTNGIYFEMSKRPA